MRDKDLIKSVRAGIEKAKSFGVSYKAMADAANKYTSGRKWDGSMLNQFREGVTDGDIGKVRALYRFLLRHRFIDDTAAGVAGTLYALADLLASDATFEEKFHALRYFINKFATKDALLNSLSEEGGKGEIDAILHH